MRVYQPGFVPIASTSAAALSAVRDQVIEAAGLRTVGRAGAGLVQVRGGGMAYINLFKSLV
jgi:hypothetical protein